MRLPRHSVPLLLLAAAAASCDDPSPKSYSPPAGPGAATVPSNEPPVAGKTKEPGKSRAPAEKKMPEMPPLTEEVAKSVLATQVAALDGDDASRQALLYLADLGDRSCLAAVREKLLARDKSGFTDLVAASIGAETLLAFGEQDGASVALAVAQQYASEEHDADEYLLHALARIQGDDRAKALKTMMDAAGSEDPAIVPLAVQLLAAAGAPETRELLALMAKDTEQDATVRGAAAIGLVRLKDAKAAEIADGLIRDATNTESPDQLDATDLLAGFAVEGATEASVYVRKLIDALIAKDDATFVMLELPAAVAAIHGKSGGAELVPWLREIGKRNDEEFSDETGHAAWVLGDDTHAAAVAKTLEFQVSLWAGVSDFGEAVEILDVAARRGLAAKEPFRRIVDSAAQVQPPAGAAAANGHLRALNLAAAHAFLKSSK